jgi:hypothetical protein
MLDKKKLNEITLILQEKLNFIHLIAIFLLVIWIFNVFVNKIEVANNAGEAVKEVVYVSNIPDTSLKILKEWIEKDKTTGFQYLFSMFDLSEVTEYKTKTIFREWIKRYLSVYEIAWGLETYLKIKNNLEYYVENVNKAWSIFEANNLWVYSFYYNDEKKWTVYLVALIGWQVFGFEYNIEIHPEMKIFTKSIADNMF